MKRDPEAGVSGDAQAAVQMIEVPRGLFFGLVERLMHQPFAVLNMSIPQPAAPIIRTGEGLPAIGTEWQGGIYAGLSIDDNKPVALVLLPGSIEDATWDKAGTWAKEQGGELPSRIDQLVLFKNLKSEFKEAAYWSGEQCAGLSDCAGTQSFNYGGQGGWRKDTTYHARAVRRIPLQ